MLQPRTLFAVNSLITVGYALAFFVAAGPLLAVYGIAPSADAVFMSRWFAVGLLANGLTTWLLRNAADSDAGRALATALMLSYAVGVVLALWGTLAGPFNGLGWIAVGFNALLGLGMARLRLVA